MRVEFKTLRELKQKLPEALAEIKRLRLLAEAENAMLESQIENACRCITGYTDWTWWATDKAIQETYGNALLYETRAVWLQSQVDKLKTHPEL